MDTSKYMTPLSLYGYYYYYMFITTWLLLERHTHMCTHTYVPICKYVYI